MQNEEENRRERTKHRLTVLVVILIAMWTLLAIANAAYDLWVAFSLTDCSFG